jgi:hypothetical protein
MKYLSVRAKTRKLLEENIGIKFFGLGLGKPFFTSDTESISNRRKK